MGSDDRELWVYQLTATKERYSVKRPGSRAAKTSKWLMEGNEDSAHCLEHFLILYPYGEDCASIKHGIQLKKLS